MRTLSIPLAAAGLLVVGACTAGVASAQDLPPSRIQLCAATDIAAVDDLLAQIAEDELVGELAPLVSITVPRDPDGVKVGADVDLGNVRTALSCEDSTEPTPTPGPTAEPTPTTDAPPTTAAPETSVPVDDSPAFTQLDQVPSGAAETGGGPA